MILDFKYFIEMIILRKIIEKIYKYINHDKVEDFNGYCQNKFLIYMLRQKKV